MSLQTACPLCRSKHSQFEFVSQNIHGHHLLEAKSKFEVYQCLDCHSFFLKDIKTTPIYFSRYYPKNYYSNSESAIAKVYQKFFTPNRSAQLIKLVDSPHKIKILDIGCGAGEFLTSLPDSNFEKFGLDTNQVAVKICLSKNIEAKKADITQNVPFAQKFDVITLNHVFEHLANPSQALRNIHQMLTPNGLLLISVPVANSLGLRLGKKFWFHLDSPRHLFIPEISGFSQYLNQQDFRLVSKSRRVFEFPLDLLWSLINYPYYWPLLIVYPFIKLLDYETTTFICQKN